MRSTLVIAKRELQAYFATPVAVVFIVIFLAVTGACTFYLGFFYERGQADLASFFVYHPWLFLMLIPPSPCGSGPRSARPAPSSC